MHLPVELIRLVALVAGPYDALSLKNTCPKLRKLITPSDLLWAEAGQRMSRHGLVETFMWASYKTGGGKIVRTLAREFLSLTSGDDELRRQLSVALGSVVVEGDIQTTRLLLELGAGKIRASPENDRRENDPYCLDCLLMTAAEKNLVDIMDVLIQAGADVNARRGKSCYKATNALAAAVEKGCVNAVHALIAYGATDSDGSAINAAAHYNRLEMVPILLSARGEDNPYVPQSVKFKSLDSSLKGDMADLLIHSGFCGGIHHVLLRAASMNKSNMVRRLLKHRDLFDQLDLNSALAEALRRKHIEAAIPLISAGASAQSLNDDVKAVYDKYSWLIDNKGLGAPA